MAEEAPEKGRDEQPQFLRRGEDYESLYANSVHFYPSEWDLKLTFGELDNDPKDNRVFVEQHTSISVPWLQAKLMNYFLTLQLGVYEIQHGPIAVPPAVMPPPVEVPLDEDPSQRRVYEYIAKIREQFFGK